MPGYQAISAVLTSIVCVGYMVTFLLHVIAFSTWDWLVSDGYSPFEEIGMFEACFDKCSRPYCPGGDDELVLNGCYSLWEWFQHDYHIQEMWYWLTPDWFLNVRIMVIVNIPFIGLCMFMLLFCTLLIWRDNYTTERLRKREILIHILQIVCTVVTFVTAILAIFTVCNFYTNAFRRDWMPMEYKNHLGYSYWLEVVCAIILTASIPLMAIATVFKLFRTPYEKGIQYAEDMHIES